MRTRIAWMGALVLTLLLLSACGTDQLPPETEEGVLIYAALNPMTNDVQNSIKRFNNEHTDVQIEVRDYSDEGGIDRLLTELVLGRVPDIMEMHYFGKDGPTVATSNSDNYHVLPGTYTAPADEYWMPYRQMAQKGYLEDLWPYIENDPELGRDAVLHAPTEAAEVNGGLFILFGRVVIFTLIGRESVVGDRYSWTLDELMEVFAAMPEDSTILRYNMTKQDVFFNLLRFSLDRFVDRGTGECCFDSQEFLDLVGFLASFPDEVGYEDPVEAEEEIKRRIKYGRQMLEGKMVDWQRDIGFSDAIWQEQAAFPGYPTADGSSGGFFYPTGKILAMSSSCKNKDAAWDYIRDLIKPRRSKSAPLTTYMNIPVNLHDYELMLWGELQQQDRQLKRVTEEWWQMNSPLALIRHFSYGSEVSLMEPLTEEVSQRHRDLVDHTAQLYWPDDDLTDIVWDVLGAYFAGDRTLDQAVQMLNNRVGLYLKEAM